MERYGRARHYIDGSIIWHMHCACWVTKARIQVNVYTGCPRRNVPDFGRMFLKLK